MDNLATGYAAYAQGSPQRGGVKRSVSRRGNSRQVEVMLKVSSMVHNPMLGACMHLVMELCLMT